MDELNKNNSRENLCLLNVYEPIDGWRHNNVEYLQRLIINNLFQNNQKIVIFTIFYFYLLTENNVCGYVSFSITITQRILYKTNLVLLKILLLIHQYGRVLMNVY